MQPVKRDSSADLRRIDVPRRHKICEPTRAGRIAFRLAGSVEVGGGGGAPEAKERHRRGFGVCKDKGCDAKEGNPGIADNELGDIEIVDGVYVGSYRWYVDLIKWG